MGADNFSTTALGRTAGDAFRTAVAQAQWEYGHGGYTGTIAEKHSFFEVKLPPRFTVTRLRKALDAYLDAKYDQENARVELTYRHHSEPAEVRKAERRAIQAQKALERLRKQVGFEAFRAVERVAAAYDDKWGAAACVEVTGAEAKRRKQQAGRAGTRDRVYLFMGQASS